MTDWRRIDTAPKDGTPVLLWVIYTHLKPSSTPEGAPVTAAWCWPGGVVDGPKGYWALTESGAYAEDDELSGEPIWWAPITAPLP